MHSTQEKVYAKIVKEESKAARKFSEKQKTENQRSKSRSAHKTFGEAKQFLGERLISVGSFVRFQTNHKNQFIQDSGYVVQSQWKDENLRIAIYDIVTKSGDKFRIITDPVKYPKDTIV